MYSAVVLVKRRSLVPLCIVFLAGVPAMAGCRTAASRAPVTASADAETSERGETREHHVMTDSVGPSESEQHTESLETTVTNDRDQQCNLLIDAVNSHTPKLTAATAGFAEVGTNPAVIEAYEEVVQAAMDEIERLEISDETVSAFAERYLGVLRLAKGIGRSLLDVASDASLLPSGAGKAEDVREAEVALVSDINEYCED